VFELANRICTSSASKSRTSRVRRKQRWPLVRRETHRAGDLDEDDDGAIRSLDEYIADLDVAILSLVDDLDAPAQKLAAALDQILKDLDTLGRTSSVRRRELSVGARSLPTPRRRAAPRACDSVSRLLIEKCSLAVPSLAGVQHGVLRETA